MKPLSRNAKKPPLRLVEQSDKKLDAVEDAVKQAYVAEAVHHEKLERLLVTMLAAVVHDAENPASGEQRAQQLADLLIYSVREAHRLSRSN
jgi:uncharacterized protein Yka (UPF0111/DUF47 family)